MKEQVPRKLERSMLLVNIDARRRLKRPTLGVNGMLSSLFSAG
jgi:hypothetical protein